MKLVTIPEDVLLQRIDNEAVLLNLSEEKYFSLNSTSVIFLDMCCACETVEQVVGLIVGRFGIDEGRAKGDLLHFLSELAEKKLIMTRALKSENG